MTNNNNVSGKSESEAKKALKRDILAKWDKFSEKEFDSLDNNGDLVAQVASKYSLDKTQAQHDVDALLNGRTI